MKVRGKYYLYLEESGREGRVEEEAWARWGAAFALWRCSARSFGAAVAAAAAAVGVVVVEGERLADCVGVADAAAQSASVDYCVHVLHSVAASAHERRRSSSLSLV